MTRTEYEDCCLGPDEPRRRSKEPPEEPPEPPPQDSTSPSKTMNHICQMCGSNNAQSMYSETIHNDRFILHIHATIEGKAQLLPPQPDYLCFQCLLKTFAMVHTKQPSPP